MPGRPAAPQASSGTPVPQVACGAVTAGAVRSQSRGAACRGTCRGRFADVGEGSALLPGVDGVRRACGRFNADAIRSGVLHRLWVSQEPCQWGIERPDWESAHFECGNKTVQAAECALTESANGEGLPGAESVPAIHGKGPSSQDGPLPEAARPMCGPERAGLSVSHAENFRIQETLRDGRY